MTLSNPQARKGYGKSPIMETMQKYPRLTAHLICESLGYFTPKAAANAIIHYQQNRPFFCEWYSHQAMGMGKEMFDGKVVTEVGRNVLRRAYRNRKHHQGYMADYQYAKAIVDRAINNDIHPDFASWF